MELRQLEYFMMVAKELHFSRAAEKLNIAQPTLSQQIKSLENQVGVLLFDRIGKRTALTEAGKILLQHSQRVFFEIDQAQAALRDLSGLQRGTLTVGSLLTCTSYLLPPAIMNFKQLYPNIELSVVGLSTEDISNGIFQNELDVGVTFLPIVEEELESIPLFSEELSVAAPLTHPLADKKEMSMKELEDLPIVLLPKSFHLRKLIDRYCEKQQIKLNIMLEMTTIESLIEMVTKGIGITILPTPYLNYLQNETFATLRLTDPTPKRNIGFVYRKDKFMCNATSSFMSEVIEASKHM